MVVFCGCKVRVTNPRNRSVGKFKMAKCKACGEEFVNYGLMYRHMSVCKMHAAEVEKARIKHDTPPAGHVHFSDAEKVHIAQWKLTTDTPRNAVRDVTTVNISHPTAFNHIPGGLGSSGVFVVEISSAHNIEEFPSGSSSSPQTAQRQVIAFKPSSPIESEMYASEFFRDFGEYLSTDILCQGSSAMCKSIWRVPHTRTLYRKEDEFISVCRSLKAMSLIQQGDISIAGMSRLSQHQYLLVEEYMDGLPLPYVSIFKDRERVFPPLVLRRLGCVVACDMLVNNWDRFPARQLWSNEGNPSNLMMSCRNEKNEEESGHPCHLVMIDQKVTPISHLPMRERYLEKVRKMCSNPNFEWLREFLVTMCGLDIGAEGTHQVEEGFRKALELLAAGEGKVLGALLDKVERRVRDEMIKGKEDIIPGDVIERIQENLQKYTAFISEIIEAILSTLHAHPDPVDL